MAGRFTEIIGEDEHFTEQMKDYYLATRDHRRLDYRSEPNQHPMSAITGLSEKLNEHENQIKDTVDTAISAANTKQTQLTTYVNGLVASAKQEIETFKDITIPTQDFGISNAKINEIITG